MVSKARMVTFLLLIQKLRNFRRESFSSFIQIIAVYQKLSGGLEGFLWWLNMIWGCIHHNWIPCGFLMWAHLSRWTRDYWYGIDFWGAQEPNYGVWRQLCIQNCRMPCGVTTSLGGWSASCQSFRLPIHFWVKSYCSTFHCYLTNNVQL